MQNHICKCVMNGVLKCKTDSEAMLYLGVSEEQYNLLSEGHYIEYYMPMIYKEVDARISKYNNNQLQREKLYKFILYNFSKK